MSTGAPFRHAAALALAVKKMSPVLLKGALDAWTAVEHIRGCDGCRHSRFSHGRFDSSFR